MKVKFTAEKLAALPAVDRDIWDAKVNGLVVRCRKSGRHVFRFYLAKGQWVTIGKVADLTIEAARGAAENLGGQVGSAAIVEISDDLGMSHREAKQKAREKVKALRQRDVRTFGEYLDKTYAEYVAVEHAEDSETMQRLTANFGAWRDTPITEISEFQIKAWRVTRQKAGIAETTINRDLVDLRGALSRAVEWKILRVHPMAAIKPLKVDKSPRVRYLSADEAARLYAALERRDETRRLGRDNANAFRRERGYKLLPAYGTYTDHVTPLVLLALRTGMRRGELFGLRWSDWDRVANLLHVRAEESKDSESRPIRLNSDARDVLATWRAIAAPASDDAIVFPGANGEALTDIKTAWGKLMKAAKIRAFRFHDCRHTFASRLVMAGVDLNAVRELLGHATLEMTLRYAHLAPEHQAAAVERIAGL